jgi:hypothetical protein
MKVNKITIHCPMTLSSLIAHFQNAIAESEYKDYIKIEPMGKLAFKVVIKKAGTSELFFTEVADKRIDGECSVMLYKSEIAFLHKGSIPAVMQWIEDRVGDLGGTVIRE